ncbi:COMPASS (complex proteins associated with Set1p) component [Lecanora helva]
MAEDNNGAMPDFLETDALPPIDNIHAPNPEPEVSRTASYGQPPPPLYSSYQLDTEMPEATPAFVPQGPITPSTVPPPPPAQRTATPTRPVNGTAEVAAPMPSKAASHGAPARRYLNEKVTGVLLEGMKRLAADRPEDPLRVLGEFLLQKSKELEGAT